MENFKVEIKEAGPNVKREAGTNWYIFVSGPKNGNYMFGRTNKGKTFFMCGNSLNSRPPLNAIRAAESAEAK